MVAIGLAVGSVVVLGPFGVPVAAAMAGASSLAAAIPGLGRSYSARSDAKEQRARATQARIDVGLSLRGLIVTAQSLALIFVERAKLGVELEGALAAVTSAFAYSLQCSLNLFFLDLPSPISAWRDSTGSAG